MNDQLIRELLHEVADDVEPGDRLEAIRAATATGGRTHRGWWAAGGVGLLAASVVTAFALTTGGAPTSSGSDPAGPAPTTAVDLPDAMDRVVPVYFVGDTPAGPRLYREFRSGPGPMSAETFAFDAALRGDALDPDYRSPWPAGTSIEGYRFSDDVLVVSLAGDVRDRPAGMTDAEARLALEQVVRTAQGLRGEGRVPVRLLIDGSRTPEVLGVPTSEPLTTSPDLDVLAHVNISDPFHGQVVDNDQPFVVTGVGNSYEGNIVTQVQRATEGKQIIEPVATIAGWTEDRLFPWEVTLDVSSLPPGEYDVVSRTDDPTGEQQFHTDSRRITIVD